MEEQQVHSSHAIKAEEFDFEYVGSKKKEKFQRLNAFLSRSKHLNFVDTLTLAAILDFQLIIIAAEGSTLFFTSPFPVRELYAAKKSILGCLYIRKDDQIYDVF